MLLGHPEVGARIGGSIEAVASNSVPIVGRSAQLGGEAKVVHVLRFAVDIFHVTSVETHGSGVDAVGASGHGYAHVGCPAIAAHFAHDEHAVAGLWIGTRTRSVARAGDDERLGAQIHLKVVTAGGDAECHIGIGTGQADGVAQLLLGHPEVGARIGGSKQTVGVAGCPVVGSSTQLGGQAEVVHHFAILVVTSVETHRALVDVVVGRTQCYAIVGSPVLAGGLAQHIDAAGGFGVRARTGIFAVSGDDERACALVDGELILALGNLEGRAGALLAQGDALSHHGTGDGVVFVAVGAKAVEVDACPSVFARTRSEFVRETEVTVAVVLALGGDFDGVGVVVGGGHLGAHVGSPGVAVHLTHHIDVLGLVLDRRVAAVARGVLPVEAIGDVELVVCSALHELESARGAVVGGAAQLHIHLALGALRLDDVAAVALLLGGDGALVVHASSATTLNHVGDGSLVALVVRVVDTRCARQSQDGSVSGHEVAVVDFLIAIATRVVVVDEGHCIAVVTHVGAQALVVEGAPGAVAGIVEFELEREVEGGTLNLVDAGVPLVGVVEPLAQQVGVAIVILAYAVGGLNLVVIHASVVARIALGHVQTESGITQVVLQEVHVGDHVGLRGGVGVVQVARAIEVLTLVGCTSSLVASGHALVGAANLRVLGAVPRHGVFLARVLAGNRFVGEVGPTRSTILVVDDQVLDDAGVLALVGGNHAAQVGLAAETTVVGKPVHGRVTHGPGGATFLDACRVGNPDEVEHVAQLIGSIVKHIPCDAITVPIEPLKHHAAVVGWPTSRPHDYRRNGRQH